MINILQFFISSNSEIKIINYLYKGKGGRKEMCKLLTFYLRVHILAITFFFPNISMCFYAVFGYLTKIKIETKKQKQNHWKLTHSKMNSTRLVSSKLVP